MGTDIEIYYKEASGNMVCNMDFNRFYDAFSLLCGVRNYYDCIPITDENVFNDEINSNWVYHITYDNYINYQHWNEEFYDRRSNEYYTPNQLRQDQGKDWFDAFELILKTYREVWIAFDS